MRDGIQNLRVKRQLHTKLRTWSPVNPYWLLEIIVLTSVSIWLVCGSILPGPSVKKALVLLQKSLNDHGQHNFVCICRVHASNGHKDGISLNFQANLIVIYCLLRSSPNNFLGMVPVDYTGLGYSYSDWASITPLCSNWTVDSRTAATTPRHVWG